MVELSNVYLSYQTLTRIMKLVYLSIQSADARNMEEPVRKAAEEHNAKIDLYCINASDVDADPVRYHELVGKTREADLILIRCMTDPTRMKAFERYENVLREIGGKTIIYAGNMEIRLMYRDLFSGSDEDYVLLGEYMRNRGAENDMGIACWLMNRCGLECEVPEPVTTRDSGISHPGYPKDVSQSEYMEHIDPSKPTIGLIYTSNLWIYDNKAHVDALITEIERIGLNVIPVFFSAVVRSDSGTGGAAAVVKQYFMEDGKSIVDAIIMATPFSQLNNSRQCSGIYTPDDQNFFYKLTGVPVIHAIATSDRFCDYEDCANGARETPINVYWPEIDGQIITVPFGSNEGGRGGPKKYVPVEDRVRHLAETAKNWASISRKKPSERKIAILMYQSRPESGRIGGAAGLDTIESVRDMLARFSSEGYAVDRVPENGRELIDTLLDNITNDLESTSSERIKEKAADLRPVSEYNDYYNRIPEFDRKRMEESWGTPPGTVHVENGKFIVPGIVNGNIYIGYQPLRSWADQMEAVYHDPVVPMPHQYLQFYRWLKHTFKADAVFHIGTHGTLEWLPGRSVGLSGKCFPDIVLDGIPNIYPYVIDDPGEGIQAKRRSEAVLIGHMCPVMRRAGTYDEIESVEIPLQEYFKARNSSQERRTEMVTVILDAVRKEDLLKDLNLSDDITVEEFESHLEDLHDYIGEIKDSIIRDGLHILGRAPVGERFAETVYMLTRSANGEIPSLRDSFYISRGYDYDELIGSPSRVIGDRTASEITTAVEDELSELLMQAMDGGWDTDGTVKLFVSEAKGDSDDLKRSLTYVCETLVPKIGLMTDEMDNMMRACAGRYVLPGPSGAPTRGNADLLPMGRNYYGVDPDIIPTRSSWEIGRRMADQMIQHHIDEKGCYPDNVGFIIWATDTMKTNGDDVAYILWLLGVRPTWSRTGGEVTGLEVVPLEELKRPRIDVTVRITGLFRDAFPNLIDLIDDAVKMVADLDEDSDSNYLAANLRRDIIESLEKGLTIDEARRRNSVRIFGCPPGGYGPGVNHAIETGEWKTMQDLADIYIAWGSYAYGRGMSGESMRDEFVKRFSQVGVTVKNMPDREIDVLDIDDVYSYLGGLNSFVKTYGNKDVMSIVGDDSDPERLKLRDAKSELQFLYRSKVLNPKFIDGLKQHGYRGVAEIANLTEYSFGWDATSEIMDDWMYEKLAERYLFDEDTKQWMMDENPHAMMDMLNRLLEAVDRGMWDAKPETLEKLKQLFLSLEERIEEINNR